MNHERFFLVKKNIYFSILLLATIFFAFILTTKYDAKADTEENIQEQPLEAEEQTIVSIQESEAVPPEDSESETPLNKEENLVANETSLKTEESETITDIESSGENTITQSEETDSENVANDKQTETPKENIEEKPIEKPTEKKYLQKENTQKRFL